MQEVTYINLLGQEVTFGSAPPYVFCQVRGTESCDVKLKTMRGAAQHGETTRALLREPRELNLTLHLMASGREAMYRHRQELCAILSPDRAYRPQDGRRARVVYRNDLGAWWTWAIPEGAPTWEKRVQSIQPSLKMTFRCDSPYWFSMEEYQDGFVCRDAGFQLPLAFPMVFHKRLFGIDLENVGHVAAPVTLRIEGSGETPALENQSTGKGLRLTSPLQSGSVLVISTDPEDLYARIERGAESVNAYGLLDAATPLSDFWLQPGMNRIVYKPGGATAQTDIGLSWFARYEGV